MADQLLEELKKSTSDSDSDYEFGADVNVLQLESQLARTDSSRNSTTRLWIVALRDIVHNCWFSQVQALFCWVP